MSTPEQRLEKLKKLLEVAAEDSATPNDLVKLTEALVSVIARERDKLKREIDQATDATSTALASQLAILTAKERRLSNTIEDVRTALSKDLVEARKRLDVEMKRIEGKIPSRNDLSGIESQIEAIQEALVTVPTEITANPQSVRDALELLSEDDRLDISFIKGLDGYEELKELAKRVHPSNFNIGLVVRSLRAGTGVSIDNTNPNSPIISASVGSGSGDVVGPASATADAIPLYSGTTGKLIKNSLVTVSALGEMTAGAFLSGNVQAKVFLTVGTANADYITDGVADQVQINQAIVAANAAGGGTVFVRSGTHAIAGNINMASNVTLLGDSRTTTFTYAASTTLKIDAKTNVEVRGIKFNGNSHILSNYGIYIQNATDVLIAENRFENMTGFGIFVTASAALTCSRINIRDNYLQGKGNADTIGGGPANSTGAIVSDINIYGNTVIQDLTAVGAGIYENVFDIVKVERVTVDNNIFWGRVQFGTEQFPNTNSKISNNILRPAIGATVTAMLVTTLGTSTSPGDGIAITGNVIQTGTIKVTGIAAHPVKHVTITGNVIKATAILNGLELTYVTESAVSGNTISNATAGVYLSNCSDFIITGNQISTCSYGIRDITGTASILIGSNSYKAITISEIVGGKNVTGVIQETPTGIVGAGNVTFTVAVAPKFIVTDTGFYIAGFGYSIATLTITMDLAPNLFIRAYS